MAPRKRAAREPRRKPNTGAIRFKKGRDLPYEAAFPIGHNEYRYDSFSTRQEATAHLDKLTAERDDAKRPRNVAQGSQLVRHFLPAWLPRKEPFVKRKTFASYQYYCELASGEIGTYRLDQVDRTVAEDMMIYFYKRGFKNVKQMRDILAQAFDYALEEKYIIGENPFRKASVPTVERRQAIALTQVQRGAVLTCGLIEDIPAVPLAPIWHLYSRLGFRRGEGLGVRWSDINWTEGTIRIAQQYTNINSETYQETPKTPKSWRVFPLPADVIELLRTHQADQIKRAASNRHWQVMGLVFTDENGGYITVSHIRHRWKLLKRRAGIPAAVTIHDLRHTAEYLMINAGVPESSRMAILGHSTARMARHYADHAREDMPALREAIRKIGT